VASADDDGIVFEHAPSSKKQSQPPMNADERR
jgi:hypothetical protein